MFGTTKTTFTAPVITVVSSEKDSCGVAWIENRGGVDGVNE